MMNYDTRSDYPEDKKSAYAWFFVMVLACWLPRVSHAQSNVHIGTVRSTDASLNNPALQGVGEFHLWFDIQRTRQFPVTGDGEIDFVDVVGRQSGFGGTYAEKHLLYPIPDDELQRNPALEQNPAYTE